MLLQRVTLFNFFSMVKGRLEVMAFLIRKSPLLKKWPIKFKLKDGNNKTATPQQVKWPSFVLKILIIRPLIFTGQSFNFHICCPISGQSSICMNRADTCSPVSCTPGRGLKGALHKVTLGIPTLLFRTGHLPGEKIQVSRFKVFSITETPLQFIKAFQFKLF